VLIISKEDFLQMAFKVSDGALKLYHKIREAINSSQKDFKELEIKCYIC